MRPDDGGENPAINLSNVDLPQPLGPTMVTNSPGRIFKEISWSALIVPSVGVRKSLETPSTWMTDWPSIWFFACFGTDVSFMVSIFESWALFINLISQPNSTSPYHN